VPIFFPYIRKYIFLKQFVTMKSSRIFLFPFFIFFVVLAGHSTEYPYGVVPSGKNKVYKGSAVHINQVGYRADAPKVALIYACPSGKFSLVDCRSGKVVFAGKTSKNAYWTAAGGDVCRADFSSFKVPGRYLIKVGKVSSFPFNIGAHGAYDSLTVSAIKAYYLWRASTDIQSRYAAFGGYDYARAAGNPDTSVFVHPDVASTVLPAGSRLSSPGGWYDAGDYDKYTVSACVTLHSLASAYDLNPDYFRHLDLNIPESDDEVPDILNEMMWEYKWLLTMQDADGSVFCKVSSLRFSKMVMPSADTSRRYMMGKSTAAALNFAAAMAIASRIYAPYEAQYPGFSQKVLSAAERAFAWAMANNKLVFHNPEGVNTGEYSDDLIADKFFWAESELFVTTHSRKYYDMLAFPAVYDLPRWEVVDGFGLYSLAMHSAELPDFVNKDYIRNSFRHFADSISFNMRNSVGGVPLLKFEWASNSLVAMNGAWLGLAYRLFGNPDYRLNAYSCFDYLLGNNVTDYCFVTGFGSKCPQNVHDRRSFSDGIPGALPGYLAGGPNAMETSDCGNDNYTDVRYPALTYLDEVCSYSTNEVAINWNAPLVLLVSLVSNF
jgi:endoglucanase